MSNLKFECHMSNGNIRQKVLIADGILWRLNPCALCVLSRLQKLQKLTTNEHGYTPIKRHAASSCFSWLRGLPDSMPGGRRSAPLAAAAGRELAARAAGGRAAALARRTRRSAPLAAAAGRGLAARAAGGRAAALARRTRRSAPLTSRSGSHGQRTFRLRRVRAHQCRVGCSAAARVPCP